MTVVVIERHVFPSYFFAMQSHSINKRYPSYSQSKEFDTFLIGKGLTVADFQRSLSKLGMLNQLIVLINHKFSLTTLAQNGLTSEEIKVVEGE